MLSRLPITVRVPLVVTVFMIAVAGFASQRVLSRLDETQSRHVQALATIYLEGLSLALVDAMVREDIWQVFDVLDRSRRRPSELRPTETIVTTADNTVIAASHPASVASQSKLPKPYQELAAESVSFSILPRSMVALAKRSVTYEGRPVGNIYAKIDIESLIVERNDVLRTLVITNALLTLVLVGLASWIVGRMMRPIRVLTDHLEKSDPTNVQMIDAKMVNAARPEYRRAFAAYNTLAKAMQEREELGMRLAEEERLASLGRLASGMAHEINNPLGGLFNALDTLKQHGDQPHVRAKIIDLVERGLKGIRDVVRAALMTYQADRDQRGLTVDDLDDMRLLMTPEARRRDINLSWQVAVEGGLALPASAVRQIVLNLVLNACQATERDGYVRVSAIANDGCLRLAIEDDGPGLPQRARDILLGVNKGPAPIVDGTGLGLWMTSRLVRECQGVITVEASELGGARVVIVLPGPTGGELRHVA